MFKTLCILVCVIAMAIMTVPAFANAPPPEVTIFSAEIGANMRGYTGLVDKLAIVPVGKKVNLNWLSPQTFGLTTRNIVNFNASIDCFAQAESIQRWTKEMVLQPVMPMLALGTQIRTGNQMSIKFDDIVLRATIVQI
ncbi:MAG: hypothetical protein V1838_04695 [Patescibacteria group bacterium]